MSATSPLAEIRVPGKQLCGLTHHEGLLWYSDAVLEEILAVDPISGDVVRRISCPDVRTGLTTFDGNLLQVVGSNRELRMIDFRTGRAVQEFPCPRPGMELCGIEANAEGVWLGYEDPPILELRSLRNLDLIDLISVPEPVAGVTAAGQYAAYCCYKTANLHLVDPQTRHVVATIHVQGNPTGLAWDGSRFWYCDHTHTVLRAMEMPAVVSLQARA